MHPSGDHKLALVLWAVAVVLVVRAQRLRRRQAAQPGSAPGSSGQQRPLATRSRLPAVVAPSEVVAAAVVAASEVVVAPAVVASVASVVTPVNHGVTCAEVPGLVPGDRIGSAAGDAP